MISACFSRYFKKKIHVQLSFFLILISSAGLANEWKWAGFEIIGNITSTKNEIQALIPIQIGQNYSLNQTEWSSWCNDIKTKFKLYSAHCTAVRYSNFEAYFVVEVIEHGFEHRSKFRSAPVETIPLATPEILEMYEKLYSRNWQLFELGLPAAETFDHGYLDYSDTEMHTIVERLIQIVPQWCDNLLTVLEKDSDLNKRAMAADLLNWTLNNLSTSIVRANSLLDDPSSLVRNNISRFTLHFLNAVSSAEMRKQIIDQLILQLDRPSHADRNKAVYNLLILAEQFPHDRPYIKQIGFSLISDISKNSILSNVKDPALELLRLIAN